MNNIINNLTIRLSDMSVFLSLASSFLLIVAVTLSVVAITRSMRNVKRRLVLERIIVESLAETLKEKGFDSPILVRGNKLSVKLKCSSDVDPAIFVEDLMKETIRKASLRGYEVSKIIDKAKSNENYINALYDKSLSMIQKNA